MAKVLFWVCVLALTGCGSFSQAMRMEKFEEASYAYEGFLRWGHYELAVGLLKERDNAQAARDLETLRKIKIIRYEVISVKAVEEESRVEQSVKIRYYFTDELLERTVIDYQMWEYDASGSWRVASGLPAFD